jgi:hypothetical protein
MIKATKINNENPAYAGFFIARNWIQMSVPSGKSSMALTTCGPAHEYG